MNCPAAVQERTAAREFFLALCDGPRSLLHGPFFVPKERENTMLESLEATLYPIVVNINNYLSSYILVFLLIAVGLWYSIRTRFVQVRCFGEGMRKVFGNLTLRGKKHASGMSSFQALATAIAAQVGTGNIVGSAGAILTGGCGSSPSSAWPPSTLRPLWPSRPAR